MRDFGVKEELTNLGSILRPVIKQLATLRNLAELLAGAAVFHGCEAVFDFLAARPASRTEIPTRVLFLGFTLIPPFLLCLLTVWLYKWSRKRPYTIWPEVNLMVGSVISVPIYTVLASLVIYNPRPVNLSELVEAVLALYSMFPLTVFSIMVYNFSITPFMLTVIFATLTGWFVRRRSRSNSSRLPSASLSPRGAFPSAST